MISLFDFNKTYVVSINEIDTSCFPLINIKEVVYNKWIGLMTELLTSQKLYIEYSAQALAH